MRKIMSVLRKPVLSILLLALVIFLLSTAVVTAQSPSPVPSATPSLTPSPSATSLPPPSIISPSPSATASPSPIITGSPINPGWAAPPLSTAALPADLSGIAAQVLPSVVSVNVDITSTDFLGQPSVQTGAGSGWVIDPNGLIVTNNHVVEGAQNISVSFSDGTTYPVQQVAADPVTDLAVIKINATGLKAVTLGDSSRLKPGNMVIAIGNALGQGLSVTAGWVSRQGVSLTIPGTGANSSATTLFDLIEVSVPINPGNSGGPLIDMLGEVVGITNAKLISTGVEAVGYAISMKTALPILQQLIQTGKIVHPYMGVMIQDVDPSIASVYGLAVKQGALISTVQPGSPAAQGGLQSGDVIVKIDNTTVTSAADAVQAIQASKIGQQVTITYYRGQTQSTTQVTLAQNPNQ